MFYDFLIIIAILMVVTVPFLLVIGDTTRNAWIRLLFQMYLLCVVFFYYAWFWVHRGQTLGLLTWKLRVETMAGEKITWRQALYRFGAAGISLVCFTLGFVWALFDRDKQTWHDRLSGTRVVRFAP